MMRPVNNWFRLTTEFLVSQPRYAFFDLRYVTVPICCSETRQACVIRQVIFSDFNLHGNAWPGLLIPAW